MRILGRRHRTTILIYVCATELSTLALEPLVGLRERVPLPKPTELTIPSDDIELLVKFRDDLKVRVDNQELASLGGADLGAINAIVGSFNLRWEPAFSLPEADFRRLETEATERSGDAQPDLAGFLTAQGPPEVLLQVGKLLLDTPEVETLEFVDRRFPEPPCTDHLPHTPNFYASPTYPRYHYADPGVNVIDAWSQGARGQGIQITNVEFGYDIGHEDLCNITGETNFAVAAPQNYPIYGGHLHHGTSTLGEIVSLDGSYGWTGLAPDAHARFITEWPWTNQPNTPPPWTPTTRRNAIARSINRYVAGRRDYARNANRWNAGGSRSRGCQHPHHHPHRR